MFSVKLSPDAVQDLKGIKTYITDELQNPIAAKNTIDKIVSTYENLSLFPESGIPVQKYISFPTDYKFVLANNYSIFYRIEQNSVLIVRILFSKRNFIQILFG